MDDLWKKKHVNVSFQDLPQDGDNEISTFSPLCETSVVRRRGSWCFLGFFREKLFKIPNSKAADLHIFIFIYLSDCFGATCLSERLVWMPLWPPDPHTYMHNVMLVCLRFNTRSSLLCRCYSSATRRPDKKCFAHGRLTPQAFVKINNSLSHRRRYFYKEHSLVMHVMMVGQSPSTTRVGVNNGEALSEDFERKTAAGYSQLKYIKGDLLCLFMFLLSFSVILTVKKGRPRQQKLLSPTENTAPERPLH